MQRPLMTRERVLQCGQKGRLSRCTHVSSYDFCMRRPFCCNLSRQKVSMATSDGDFHVVDVDSGADNDPFATAVADIKPRMSTILTYSSDDRTFKVLLALITKLWQSPSQLEEFLRSRPEPTSMPFLMWLADQEEAATGPEKAMLTALCEQLVTYRERLDDERMEDLYTSTLGMLADDAADAAATRFARQIGSSRDTAFSGVPAIEEHGSTCAFSSERAATQSEATTTSYADPHAKTAQEQEVQLQQQRRAEALTLLSTSPDLYAVMLAEKLTGTPALVEGYDPMYDLILKAAPPAALTVEGVKRAHAEAQELAKDLKQRRKRSVASLIGRAQLTEEQADILKAGSAAKRILEMLLTLPSHEDRAACLPDCFTPPEPGAAEQAVAVGAELVEEHGAGMGAQQEQDEEEELWCTPSQLLSEVDVRIRSITTHAAASSGHQGPAALLPAGSQHLTGEDLLEALQQLRVGIRESWLDSMRQS